MGRPYFDRESVQRRLNNTICLYKGEPVYVSTDAPRQRMTRRDIETIARENAARWGAAQVLTAPTPPPAPAPTLGDNTVVAYKLPVNWSEPLYINYTDENFSYKAFPLGYLNWQDRCYYLYRMPSRQQAQGLAERCIRYLPSYLSIHDWFTTQQMRDCILGKYPTLHEARDLIREYKKESVAFSRDAAIARLSQDSLSLFYKGRKIGFCKTSQLWFTLFPSDEKKALRLALQDKVYIL